MDKSANIAVIGLGYVGLPLAVEFGKKYRTFGYDINKSRVKELKQGFDKTLEVSDNELGKSKFLSFTSDNNEIYHCDVYIVTVPTPVDNLKNPILLY